MFTPHPPKVPYPLCDIHTLLLTLCVVAFSSLSALSAKVQQNNKHGFRAALFPYLYSAASPLTPFALRNNRPQKGPGQDLALAPLKRAFLSIESSSALVPSNFGLLYFLESFQSSQKLLGNFRATPKKTQDQDCPEILEFYAFPFPCLELATDTRGFDAKPFQHDGSSCENQGI